MLLSLSCSCLTVSPLLHSLTAQQKESPPLCSLYQSPILSLYQLRHFPKILPQFRAAFPRFYFLKSLPTPLRWFLMTSDLRQQTQLLQTSHFLPNSHFLLRKPMSRWKLSAPLRKIPALPRCLKPARQTTS